MPFRSDGVDWCHGAWGCPARRHTHAHEANPSRHIKCCCAVLLVPSQLPMPGAPVTLWSATIPHRTAPHRKRTKRHRTTPHQTTTRTCTPPPPQWLNFSHGEGAGISLQGHNVLIVDEVRPGLMRRSFLVRRRVLVFRRVLVCRTVGGEGACVLPCVRACTCTCVRWRQAGGATELKGWWGAGGGGTRWAR